LIDDAIGQRIGKRHAQLDDVGPCGGHRMHQIDGRVGNRMTSHDVGNQGTAALRLQTCEAPSNSTANGLL
jgi:hypothetical protein